MFVEFEDRTGILERVEMEIEEPCPICCGMLFLIDESNTESGYRCSSCSILFEPADDDDVRQITIDIIHLSIVVSSLSPTVIKDFTPSDQNLQFLTVSPKTTDPPLRLKSTSMKSVFPSTPTSYLQHVRDYLSIAFLKS